MKTGLIGIVGDAAKADFWGTMAEVARVGYRGVEAVEGELLSGDVTANLARFNDLGLSLLTTSASREQLRGDFDTVLSRALAVKAPRVSVWWSPADTKDGLLKDAELYNTAGAKLAAHGIKLCYHNHNQEFRNTIDGVYALDFLALHTDPAALHFTVDVAWVTYGGENPVKVLTRLGNRVAAIHVKDFYDLDTPNCFTAVGTGVVDIAGSVRAAEAADVEWMVVEQDRLRNLTPMETITVSYLYLKERGLVTL